MSHPSPPAPSGIDPLTGALDRLNQVLTTARGSAESATGSLVVETSGNGTIEIAHIDDQLASGHDRELAAALNGLIRASREQALSSTRNALDDFRSDPRIAEAASAIEDAIAKPPSTDPTPRLRPANTEYRILRPRSRSGLPYWQRHRRTLLRPA
ncbi:hypothetical protein [Rhodococcus marinonascens]|uniref:hypothetical protein n=1 Tax=Rhodococcus marinonascens TaxID=38311 RepID=UPI0009348739|nr:hypothetical protein [Rhodococcus marinonascens]